jgi:pimeloyl-ACP methyl ester carboxylesterase
LSYLHLNEEGRGFHILGHSWGTVLAQLFVLNNNSNQTSGLQSIILSGPLSDSQSYVKAQWDEKEGNIGSMIPPFVKERIRQLEVDKLYDSTEYRAIDDTLTGFFTCARLFYGFRGRRK